MRSQPAATGLNQPSFSKPHPRSNPGAVPALPCSSSSSPSKGVCDLAPNFWWFPDAQSTFLTLFQEEFSSQILWDAPQRCNLDLGLMKFHPVALALVPKVIQAPSQVPKRNLPKRNLAQGVFEGNIELGEPQDGTTIVTSWITAGSTDITCPGISDNSAAIRADFYSAPG